MFCRRMAAGVLGALAVLAWTTSVRAGDTFQLNLTKDNAAEVKTLGFDGDADTVAVRGYAGYRGGYHGGYAGYRGGYHGGYAGYRGGYYGYRGGYAGYRGFYGYPFHHGYHSYYPYYRNFYPRYYYPGLGLGLGYGYSYYQPYYYSSPVYYSPAPAYYYSTPSSCPISYGVTTQPFSASLSLPLEPSTRPAMPAIPPGEALPGAGTYPYDGGPQAPVPSPRVEPAPTRVPLPATVPLEGRVVSLPAQPTKFAYPAYGEEPVRTSFAQDRPITVKNEVAQKSKK